MPRLTVHNSPAPWLEHRRSGVTSTDMPVLFGQGYAGSNIFNLFLKKLRAEPEDPGMRWRFRAGHHFEQLIAERVEEETGWSLWDPGPYAVVEHDGHAVRALRDDELGPCEHSGLVSEATGVKLMATPDRLRVNEPLPLTAERFFDWAALRAALEFKTADRGARQGYQESKAFAYALTQVTTAMMCCDLQEGAVCVSFGLMDDFLVIPVVRSAALEAAIWERAREFWAYVEAREPPGQQFIDESREVGDALAEIYAEETGEVVELEASWGPVLERLAELPGKVKELTDEQQLQKNLLAHRMGEATIGVVSGCPKRAKYTLSSGGAANVDTRWSKRVVRVVKA